MISMTLVIAIVVPSIVAPISSWPLVNLLIKVDSLEKEMRELATYDSLTEVLNRWAFFHNATMFIDLAKREQKPCTVLAVDLDNFKLINDHHGHSAGDKVLKNFGTTANAIMRKSDLIGRIGGEEFALLLPNTSVEEASIFSERLHHAVRELSTNYDQTSIKFTISIGLISLLPDKTDDIEGTLKKADQSLYLAKAKGRNCTVIFDASEA